MVDVLRRGRQRQMVLSALTLTESGLEPKADISPVEQNSLPSIFAGLTLANDPCNRSSAEHFQRSPTMESLSHWAKLVNGSYDDAESEKENERDLPFKEQTRQVDRQLAHQKLSPRSKEWGAFAEKAIQTPRSNLSPDAMEWVPEKSYSRRTLQLGSKSTGKPGVVKAQDPWVPSFKKKSKNVARLESQQADRYEQHLEVPEPLYTHKLYPLSDLDRAHHHTAINTEMADEQGHLHFTPLYTQVPRSNLLDRTVFDNQRGSMQPNEHFTGPQPSEYMSSLPGRHVQQGDGIGQEFYVLPSYGCDGLPHNLSPKGVPSQTAPHLHQPRTYEPRGPIPRSLNSEPMYLPAYTKQVPVRMHGPKIGKWDNSSEYMIPARHESQLFGHLPHDAETNGPFRYLNQPMWRPSSTVASQNQCYFPQVLDTHPIADGFRPELHHPHQMIHRKMAPHVNNCRQFETTYTTQGSVMEGKQIPRDYKPIPPGLQQAQEYMVSFLAFKSSWDRQVWFKLLLAKQKNPLPILVMYLHHRYLLLAISLKFRHFCFRKTFCFQKTSLLDVRCPFALELMSDRLQPLLIFLPGHVFFLWLAMFPACVWKITLPL